MSVREWPEVWLTMRFLLHGDVRFLDLPTPLPDDDNYMKLVAPTASPPAHFAGVLCAFCDALLLYYRRPS